MNQGLMVVLDEEIEDVSNSDEDVELKEINKLKDAKEDALEEELRMQWTHERFSKQQQQLSLNRDKGRGKTIKTSSTTGRTRNIRSAASSSASIPRSVRSADKRPSSSKDNPTVKWKDVKPKVKSNNTINNRFPSYTEISLEFLGEFLGYCLYRSLRVEKLRLSRWIYKVLIETKMEEIPPPYHDNKYNQVYYDRKTKKYVQKKHKDLEPVQLPEWGRKGVVSSSSSSTSDATATKSSSPSASASSAVESDNKSSNDNLLDNAIEEALFDLSSVDAEKSRNLRQYMHKTEAVVQKLCFIRIE